MKNNEINIGQTVLCPHPDGPFIGIVKSIDLISERCVIKEAGLFGKKYDTDIFRVDEINSALENLKDKYKQFASKDALGDGSIFKLINKIEKPLV